MALALTALAALTAALAAPPLILVALVSAAAIAGRRRAPAPPPGTAAPQLLFVIPAHDEAGSIAATVRSCLAVDYPPGRFGVAVIADNCTDATAAVARDAGARVVERVDPTRRSKGHALEYFFGVDREASAGVDAFVLVDADTTVAPDLLARFADDLARGMDWVQGYYTTRNPEASWRTRLLTVSFSLFNGVWLLGLDRLGLGSTLKGNGMCFSRAGLARVPWRAFGLVEDLEFSWRLRVAGERVHFDRLAVVRGEMVSRGGRAASSQRHRWEAGRRALRRAVVGDLIRTPHLGPWRKFLALGDLLMPPLSTIVLMLAASVAMNLGVAMMHRSNAGITRIIGILEAVELAVLANYLGLSFSLFRVPPKYMIYMIFVPYYVAWKLLNIRRSGPGAWVRTQREATQ